MPYCVSTNELFKVNNPNASVHKTTPARQKAMIFFRLNRSAICPAYNDIPIAGNASASPMRPSASGLSWLISSTCQPTMMAVISVAMVKKSRKNRKALNSRMPKTI